MFAFNLPPMAVIYVNFPTGGGAALVHTGNGRFLSRVPPVMLAGVSMEAEREEHGLPIEWDGRTLPGDSPSLHPVAFVFDPVSGQKAVEEAAARGDNFANVVLDELRQAEQTLAARQAVMQRAVQAAPAPSTSDDTAAQMAALAVATAPAPDYSCSSSDSSSSSDSGSGGGE